jgi:capsid protein
LAKPKAKQARPRTASPARKPSPTKAKAAAPTGRKFQYDAVDGRGKRRTPVVSYGSEDYVLNAQRRARVQSNTRDIVRNFAIAAWAIRRHLDYVATFEFHPQNSDRDFNRYLLDFFWNRAARYTFDAAGRHSWGSGFRMLEAQAVVAGDNGLLIRNDGAVQGIEGDRVRQVDKATKLGGRWEQGVKCTPEGRHLAYAIHTRKGNGFEFERTVAAGNVVWHGYYDRWDQVRGISPIVAALNPLRDVYENFDYALAKAKVTQLFALAFFRKASEAAGDILPGGGETVTDEDGNTRKEPYSVDFGKGPVVLDLDPGDEAKFLESQSPSNQFQDYMELSIMVALKALDIPLSFFDEAHTNFFGSRGSWLHYERSCVAKREPLQDAQDRLFIRQLLIGLRDGTFELPRGMQLTDVKWEFVPRGVPWWKPSEEVRGDREAVLAGFDNPASICLKRGTGDVYDNIDRTAEVMEYARTKGVTLSYDVGPAPANVEIAGNAN